ncbi:GNAT family N-acetyltransferase [Streptacidiphilus rugosus]|uniref:GNAT family N-acetyltransferase n=1 Tax=Streptacidiphilus rugosus TaxID=405783 RepID=UPI0006899AEC|nr:GNAT family N-acetyltransferase [Streptacidiphilus rugosus]
MAPQAERTPSSARPSAVLVPLALGDWVDEFTDVQAQANGFPLHETAARRGMIASHTDEPGIRSVGAFNVDRLVGFAFGAPFDTRWSWAARMTDALAANRNWAAYGAPFWLLEIHVVPGLWRQKIGTRLLAELLSTASDQWIGLTRLASAHRARQFYERAGFCDLPTVPAPPGYVVMGAPPVTQRVPDTFCGDGSRTIGTASAFAKPSPRRLLQRGAVSAAETTRRQT